MTNHQAANYQPVSRKRHGSMRWTQHADLRFAAHESFVPLVTAEFSKAMMSFPIAFMAKGEDYVPVALFGLQPGHNVFVRADGQWAGQYVPAFLRASPFALRLDATGKSVLCVDEASGLLCEGPAGQPFFNELGEPSPAIQGVLQYLTHLDQCRRVTQVACAVLKKHALIQPWTVAFQNGTTTQSVPGLFQIDETALNALSADALLELRKVAALSPAYCQLLSIQQLPRVSKLVVTQTGHTEANAWKSLATNGELDLEFMNNGGALDLSALR